MLYSCLPVLATLEEGELWGAVSKTKPSTTTNKISDIQRYLFAAPDEKSPCFSLLKMYGTGKMEFNYMLDHVTVSKLLRYGSMVVK